MLNLFNKTLFYLREIEEKKPFSFPLPFKKYPKKWLF